MGNKKPAFAGFEQSRVSLTLTKQIIYQVVELVLEFTLFCHSELDSESIQINTEYRVIYIDSGSEPGMTNCKSRTDKKKVDKKI